MTVADDHVAWFRNSSPYINAHRGRTFVVMVPGSAVDSDYFQPIVHDFALLHSLGIKLVLVHGARQQITHRLNEAGIDSTFDHHTRITDPEAMQPILASVGAMRFKLEGLFSMGLANSPMYKTSIQLVSGNFVIAKPMGIRHGRDYQYSGEVRRIQVDAIRQQLDNHNVVLLSPIGCSPTGELFNLNSNEVASAAAIALKADKLILMGNEDGIRNSHNQLMREMTPHQAVSLLSRDLGNNVDIERQLTAACHATSNGVSRSHLVSYRTDGAILKELFTRDGCGTMVTLEIYESIRQAHINDVGGIIELITPLEEAGILVRRSRELLENEIQQFTVIARDGMIIGCAALYPFNDNQHSGEIACVAVHPDYRNQQRAKQLLLYLEKQARKQNIKQLFVLTTQAAHWFIEHGFAETAVEQLPGERRQMYNYQRNSKVFHKTI